MFGSLFIFTALVLFGYLIWKQYLFVKQTESIPGPKQNFLFGNALEIFSCTNPVALFGISRKYARQFKRLYKFVICNILVVNIHNPVDAECLISSSKNIEKGMVYRFLRPWLRDGLLLSNGKKWHNRRRLLTPTFHFHILNEFSVVLGELTQRMVEGLEDKLDQTVDLATILTQFTLASTCETAMGTGLRENDHKWKNYKNAIKQLSHLVYHRFTKIPLHFDSIYRLSPFWIKQQKALKDLHNFTGQVIDDRKHYLDNKENSKLADTRKKKHTPMLDLLIAAEKEGLIDNIGIQEEVDTFMFEGHDTTSSGLTFCLMLLANNSHIQEKIFKELKDIFGDSTRPATMEDLTNMNYLECCLKESLRLYPPVTFINRITSEDLILSGHKIPAGTSCNVQIYDLHRQEDLFPNPELFDPDRFLSENYVKRHPYAYIPFSAGPRNCIGQRFAMMMMKSALSGILRRYKLLPVTKPEEILLITNFVLKSSGPVQVIFTERK